MYKNNPKYRSSLYKCGRYYLCLNTDLAATLLFHPNVNIAVTHPNTVAAQYNSLCRQKTGIGSGFGGQNTQETGCPGYPNHSPCTTDSQASLLVVAGFALCIKRHKHFLVSKLPRNVYAFSYARLSHTRKKRTNPKAPTSSKSVLHSGPPLAPACHPRVIRGALGKSIVAKCNVYKIFTALVAANLTARCEK